MTAKVLSVLPEPTVANPYAQLEWIFARAPARLGGESQIRYRTALSRYIKYLEAIQPNGDAVPPFILAKEWDRMACRRLQLWHDQNNIPGTPNYLTTGTIRSVESAVRGVMLYAFEHRLIAAEPFHVPRPAPVRETQIRSAYSDEDMATILDTIGPELAFARRVAAGCKPTGRGSDPRLDGRTGKKGTGFCNPDKLVWYFENVLHCRPVVANYARTRDPVYNLFFNGCKVVHGSIEAFYRKMGCSLLIDVDLLAPLVIKLAAETGLNVESIFSLRRDCFKLADSLTGLPYLEYYKERSQGEMLYPVPLLDDKAHREPLRGKQSVVVRKTIELILQLTEPLVADAPPEVRDNLLLVQRASATKFHPYGSIMAMTHRHVWDWMEKMFKAVEGDDFDTKSFNLSRFRPTFVTDLVRRGHDIFEIQALLGHRSILTTYGYISSHNIAEDFYADMTRQLEAIKANSREFKGIPIAVAGSSHSKEAGCASKPYRAGLCHCRDPYAPPERIRNASKYVPGNACTYFNMCLTCENVLITEGSLPKLINYKLQIEMELSAGLANEPRKTNLYEKTLSIIGQILQPDELFTQDELDHAHELARVEVDEVLDEFLFV